MTRDSGLPGKGKIPPDNALVGRVRAALGGRDVQEKKMFGGIAFMVRGKMCISVGRDRIMCRIDPAFHESAVKREGCRAVTMKGREYRGYVHVDADALKSLSALEYWIGLSLEYNGRAPASRGKARQQRRV
jgi:TfoX/Sxy family transcriptional regulator of competence genes